MTPDQIIGVILVAMLLWALGYVIGQYRTEDKYKNHVHELESECEALHKSSTNWKQEYEDAQHSYNDLLKRYLEVTSTQISVEDIRGTDKDMAYLWWKQNQEMDHHTPDCSEYKIVEPRDDSWNDMNIMKLYDGTYWEVEKEMLHNEDKRIPGEHQP